MVVPRIPQGKHRRRQTDGEHESEREAPPLARERCAVLGERCVIRQADLLDLDPATLNPDDPAADRLVILRHTLMNPWLIDRENGISYLERYFEFLARRM